MKAFVALVALPCLAAVAPPPNAPATFQIDQARNRITISYNGGSIFSGTIEPANVEVTQDVRPGPHDSLTQTFTFHGDVTLRGRVTASPEAFPAETLSAAQKRFPYIRTSVGMSRNLRNNAVYDRRFDWELQGPPDGATRIEPAAPETDHLTFDFTAKGADLTLQFRPRYYQKHKNIAYFEPWTYKIRQDSIAGWCSWWAFRTSLTEKDIAETAAVLVDKLRDYGYEYMQIDDGYQSDNSGLPDHWLATNPRRFPGGLAQMYEIIKSSGMRPALWVNIHFGDKAYAEQHPDWFIRQPDGQLHKGRWIDYAIDGSSPAAIDNIIRPLYRSLRDMGWQYVKVDTLRHLIYDAINEEPEYYRRKEMDGLDAFRNVVRAMREELGPRVFMLACWGVLPEVAGLADSVRLGTDGFGPATLQQYNSWNGVVWRNDPDHVDILPQNHGTGGSAGDLRDTIIRPVLASLGSGALLLSDRPSVYADDRNLEGARRAAPVLFSLPGQLYDFDPARTESVISMDRHSIRGGSAASPIDAVSAGDVCPWWLMEIDRPFEHWNILSRLSWNPLPDATVKFADLGLSGDREYIVYEYWSHKLVGVFKGQFRSPAQEAREVRIYSIREKLDRPQLISTNRHISQGGVDLGDVRWDGRTMTLSGRSSVVRNDRYALSVFVPPGRKVAAAEIGGQPAKVQTAGPVSEISFTPAASTSVSWSVKFE
jgi:alpha-galactosidase